MKINLHLRKVSILIAIAFLSLNVKSQVKEVVFHAAADVTLANGTGQSLGDFKSRNFGADGNFEMCNFDDNENLMSYFEGWLKFDLTTLPDSIPEGHQILFAEIKFKISNNAGGQGFKAYHLFNIDDWTEGNGTNGELSTEEGLTWDEAQGLGYEDEGNYTLITTNPEPGGISSYTTFNITEPILYELGEEGNKILTLRLTPFYDEYDVADPTKQKKWLGFYSRESPYNLPDGAEYNPDCGNITFWIGPEQPTIFSDAGGFGDIGNYKTSPDKFGYWMVGEDEGDDRLKLASRPAPIEGTPGALAIYDLKSFTDFDLSLKAKSTLFAETDKADFTVVFGYQDMYNYSYAYLIGNDDGGLYTVKDSVKSLVSAQETPAIVDALYHDYRVVRTGNSVTVYIDNNEYLSFEDVAFGAEGKIGVGSYNDTVIFDDILEGAQETDFTELLATIDSAEAILDTATIGTANGEFTQEVVDALQDSIDNAQAVADDTEADQGTVNNANDMLLASISQFIKNANGLYKADLAAVIENAEAKIDTSVAGTDVGQYPEAAISEFQDAIDSSKVIMDATDITQDDVDGVVIYLQAAESIFDSELITTGIRGLEHQELKIYPNPSLGRLTVETESEMVEISIINVIGQTVMTRRNIQSRQLSLDISGINTGVYFIKCLQINGNESITRLIKR